MSEITKHVGMINNTGKRCAVAFLQIPDKLSHALVIDTEALPERIHDPLMSLIRSSEAQQVTNLGEVLGRRMMPDTGRTVLEELHTYGYLQPQPVENISLFPRPNASINLADMLEAMGRLEKEADKAAGIVSGEGEGITEVDVASTPVEEFSKVTENIPENDAIGIASNMLAQADLMIADANALKEKAYAIAPGLRPVVNDKKVTSNRKTVIKEANVESEKTTNNRKSSSRKTKAV